MGQRPRTLEEGAVARGWHPAAPLLCCIRTYSPPPPSRLDSERSSLEGSRGSCGERGSPVPVVKGDNLGRGRGAAFVALSKGCPEAPGSYTRSVSVPFIHRPMGRGSGALTWWESFEVAKVAWHRGGGGAGWREPSCPSSPRQKGKERREEGVGGGSGSSDLQNPPPPPPPGRPSREARTVSSRTARTTLPLPPFFPANVYLNARAHTEIVRLFYPSGKKEQGVERKRRQSEELLGRALHSEPRLGAGTLLPPPPPTRSLPGPAACASGSASQGTRFWGHRETFGRHCRGRQKRQRREGPCHRLSLLRRPGRPAQAARHREAGRSRGPGEARRGSPARGCGARGSLETTLPGDALGGLQGPPPRRARHLL